MFQPVLILFIKLLSARVQKTGLSFGMCWPIYMKKIGATSQKILDLTFFSYEVCLHFTGYVNKQNMRIWSTEKPYKLIEITLHSQKLCVLLVVSCRRIIDPIFLMTQLMVKDTEIICYSNFLKICGLTKYYYCPYHQRNNAINLAVL